MLNFKQIIFFSAFVFASNLSVADEPRHRSLFMSENQKFYFSLVPTENKNEEWVFVEAETKDIKFKISEELSSKSVIISNYGKHFIVIDDFSESYWESDPTVLSFYFQDSLLKSYKLNQLLKNIHNIMVSVCHFMWFPCEKEMTIENIMDFKLVTFELVHYTFDIVTGNIIENYVDASLEPNDTYVFGKVKIIENGKFEMTVVTTIQGKTKYGDKIKFTTNENLMDDFMYATILRNNKLVKSFKYYINLGSPEQ